MAEIPSKKNAIIFDWDDTLFPTSALTDFHKKVLSPTAEDQIMLYDLSLELIKIFNEASTYGKVFIITNSIEDWVERCSKFAMPLFHNFLMESKAWLHIHSARDKHIQEHPDDFMAWKIKTFDQIGGDFNNFLSIGDSSYERVATLQLISSGKIPLAKSVKLKSFPTTSELMKQIKYLTVVLGHLIRHPESLDVQLNLHDI